MSHLGLLNKYGSRVDKGFTVSSYGTIQSIKHDFNLNKFK